MAIEKISSTAAILQRQCRSLAPATIDIVQSLAGRVRYLYELATGVPAHTDGNATPLNPQGTLGVDRSGPPWGDAHLHPLWIAEGITASANYYGESPYLTTAYGYTKSIVADLYVRPFEDVYLAPYSIGKFSCRAVRPSASTDVTLTIRVYHGPDTSYDYNSSTMTVGSALTTSGTMNVPLKPGMNSRLIEFIQTSNNAGADIITMAIGQSVRRSH